MRIPLAIVLLVAVVLALFWLFRPATDPALMSPRSDLPWQVQAYPDGTSKVLDLRLGQATLADAIVKFGRYETLAVFAGEDAGQVLEAYFGTVHFGPLTAKVVVTLAAEPNELTAMVQASPGRQGSPTGDWKFPLAPADWAAQHGRVVQTITYIPTYSGLEGSYFRERLGEPQAWKLAGAHAIQWFYPERGLSLLLNSKGEEVLEFVPPRDMQLPKDVEYTRSPALD